MFFYLLLMLLLCYTRADYQMRVKEFINDDVGKKLTPAERERRVLELKTLSRFVK